MPLSLASGDVLPAEALRGMSTADLRQLATMVRAELTMRSDRIGPEEFEALAAEAFRSLFSSSGVSSPAMVAPGVVAVGGMIRGRDETLRQHKCQLFTVVDPDDHSESWVWDSDALHSGRSRVGNISYSVSLRVAHVGMILVRHAMTSDGMRHTRTSTTAWQVTDVSPEGDVTLSGLPSWVPAALPPPHGAESAGSAGRERGYR